MVCINNKNKHVDSDFLKIFLLSVSSCNVRWEIRPYINVNAPNHIDSSTPYINVVHKILVIDDRVGLLLQICPGVTI